MECNKDEAVRAKEIAEKKMANSDFAGAQRIALKAQSLYPELENINHLLAICDVHCAAQSSPLGSEKDWYAILKVERFADESVVKKQYRRLALILHPDKNRFPGAEGAFKLICEANTVLSDPLKKSLFDNKIRALGRSAPGNPPPHHINKNSQLNKQYGAQNVHNGWNSSNQQQANQSTSTVKQEVSFWTSCPYCGVRYQYYRRFINTILVCAKCSKRFLGSDIGPQEKTSESKLGQASVQNMPSKPVSSKPDASEEKKVKNKSSSKIGDQSNKASSTSYAGSQGTTSRRNVPAGVRNGNDSQGIQTTCSPKDGEDFPAKGTDTSSHVETESGKPNGEKIDIERGDMKNRSRKRGRTLGMESSDISGDSDTENVTMKGDFGDLANDKSESSQVRRSSRKRQNVSYEETNEEFFVSSVKRKRPTKQQNETDQRDALDNSKSKSKETGKGSDCDTERKASQEIGGDSPSCSDTVKIESDPDHDSISEGSDRGVYDCPEPEFSDFEKERDKSHFAVNQFWACYDTLDSMPRFYAKVKKVCVTPSFELTITWLEAVPIDKPFEKWVDKELPVGCGSFKLGKTEKTSLRLSFSHQVHCEKGKKRNSLFIYPRVGEVWALLKDWDLKWASDQKNYQEFKYEIVEVLSDFVAGMGIKVCYLDKVEGFVSLFQRASQSETNSFFIPPNQLYKFSHLVPFFKMNGSEREGVPIGSYELDPAVLPLNPDHLYYPGRAKLESRTMDTKVHRLPPKSGETKHNCVASESSKTPKKNVIVEDIKGDEAVPRRSPRGSNVRQSRN